MATATPAFTIEETPEAQMLDVTSEMFFQMIEAGVFPRECCVFLWAGRLYERMAKTMEHSLTVYKIQEKLQRPIAPEWLIWTENPVVLDEKHAPLPDVMLVRGPLECYEDENWHPQAADVGLIVEITVSSLMHDLTVRAETFARAQVPHYWVADVRNRRIIEHSAPKIIDGVGSYVHVQSRQRGDEIRLVLDGREGVDLTTPLFFAMIEACFVLPERRVFLWGGRLCEKMAKTVVHSLTAYAIKDNPVAVNDLLTSICHTVKIDPAKENMSSVGRPIKIADDGKVVTQLFS